MSAYDHGQRVTAGRLTRRQLLGRCGAGFAALALPDLFQQAGLLQAAPGRGPFAPRAPHFPGKARRVVHLFMNGAVSQVDTFDPKPALKRYENKPLPMPLPPTDIACGGGFPSPFKFHKCGESGIEVSEVFPHIGSVIDDLCVIRSMHTNSPNHDIGHLMMNCGDPRQSRPSVGSWVTYGLGTENENLPGFIALCPGGRPRMDSQNWQSGFLPAAYQGTYIDSARRETARIIENIKSPTLSPKEQRQQLDLLQRLDQEQFRAQHEEAALEARLQSFELAYRMQFAALDAFDIDSEPKAIRKMYGPGIQGRQMLVVRRLLERGVRFIQVYHGPGGPWDHHQQIAINLRREATACDQAIAALIKDLKQRGMLEDTLIIWGGEFGRTPAIEIPRGKPNGGRDHNHHGFSMWLAGGGVRGGHVHGATDEFGYTAVEKPVHIHDLHATILHLLGFDHERLTYRYAGRDFRLTDVHGRVVREIIA
jgi:hypothetical protein